MTAVEKRVDARIRQEQKELRSESLRLTKRRVAQDKDAARIRDGVNVVFEVLSNGAVLSATQMKHADAGARLVRISRDLNKLNIRLSEISDRLAKLETKGERDRRLRESKQIGAVDKPIPGPEAAKMVLLRNNRPMHVRELTERMLESGTVKLTGKTPDQTVSAYLAKLAKKGDTFVRIAPGVFDLKDRPAKKTKADKPTPEPADETQPEAEAAAA